MVDVTPEQIRHEIRKQFAMACPTSGALPRPCPGVHLTADDQAIIRKEFKGLIPAGKLDAAIGYAISNHEKASRDAKHVLASLKEKEEFTGARGKKKKRKTRRKIQKGGVPEWVKDKVCTLIIMLTVGGSFWMLYPILEGFLVSYGVFPALCSTGAVGPLEHAMEAVEHVSVYFGSQMTHGAVLTCLERDNQHIAALGAITLLLTASGYVTRETVRNSYNETHAWVKEQLFGRGGIFGEPVSPAMHTPPSPPRVSSSPTPPSPAAAPPTPPSPAAAPPAAPVAHANPLAAQGSSSSSAASSGSLGQGKKRRSRRRGRRKSKRGGRKSKRRTSRRHRTRRC